SLRMVQFQNTGARRAAGSRLSSPSASCRRLARWLLAACLLPSFAAPASHAPTLMPREQQLTFSPTGHILTNTGVCAPHGCGIVYDVRSDAAGDRFDGDSIEAVDVRTRGVRVLYRSERGAKCGVATYSPVASKVVFIHGPEDPPPDWQYGPTHRRG